MSSGDIASSERISVSCFVVTLARDARCHRGGKAAEKQGLHGVYSRSLRLMPREWGETLVELRYTAAVRRGQNLHGSPRRLRRSSSRPVQLARLLAVRSTAMSAPSVWCAARRERVARRGRGAARLATAVSFGPTSASVVAQPAAISSFPLSAGIGTLWGTVSFPLCRRHHCFSA